MKKYLIEDFEKFDEDGLGYINCPTGDYSAIKEFPAHCGFAVNSIFGTGTHFGEDTILGEGCTINSDSIIGKYSTLSGDCLVGDNVKFGSYCHLGGSFSDNCTFGEHCFFNSRSTFGMNCSFGSNSCFMAGCSFESIASFGEGCAFHSCRFHDCLSFGRDCKFTDCWYRGRGISKIFTANNVFGCQNLTLFRTKDGQIYLDDGFGNLYLQRYFGDSSDETISNFIEFVKQIWVQEAYSYDNDDCLTDC